MKVLLCIHSRLDGDAGAPGATLALGGALGQRGLAVDYLSFDHAYGALTAERVSHQLRFPWHVAGFLARNASRFNVIDASTGDTWLWASLRRPGASGRPALVTRSHGLEQLADESARRAAREGGPPLSWKYPLYHGGARLWEVGRSLCLSDACVLLNSTERDYLRDRLGVPAERLSVLPNGIADHFLRVPPPDEPAGAAVRLAFVGGWLTRKGREVLVEATTRIAAQGLAFSLSIFGSGEAPVLGDFPEGVRAHVRVTPSFGNAALPELLAGHELLVMPSLFEGASVALLEAMACGLAPVASAVGAAAEVIEQGRNGLLVETGDADAVAAAVARLAADRDALVNMRQRAWESARSYRWSDVAARTVEVYERALVARSPAAAGSGAR